MATRTEAWALFQFWPCFVVGFFGGLGFQGLGS